MGFEFPYFSQRIVEFWNGLPSDVANASTVNSFKGRLDKHWEEYMFALELPPPAKICYFLSLTYRSAKGHQAYQAAEDGKW